jgi:hypothetical protein
MLNPDGSPLPEIGVEVFPHSTAAPRGALRIDVDGTGAGIIAPTFLDILGTGEVKHRLELVARISKIHLHSSCLHHHPQQSSRGRSPDGPQDGNPCAMKAAKNIHNPPDPI